MSVRITDLPESGLTANLANSVFVFVDVEADVTYKIPADQMNLGGGGANTKLLPWELVTSNTTAVDGSRFLANTSNGSFFITLPIAPVVGSSVEIADDNNFANTNLFISGNGNTIENAYDGIEVDIGSLIMQMIYNGNTWQIYASSATAETPDYVDPTTGEIRVPGTGEVGQVQYVGTKNFIRGTPTITTNGRNAVIKTYKPNRVEIGTLGITGNFWYTEHANLESYIDVYSNTSYFTYNYYGSGVSFGKDGNLYVIGGNGQDKALLVRYDVTGNVLSSNSISHSQFSYTTGECLELDSNQNTFIFTVNTDGFSNTVSTLTKLDANGIHKWSKTSYLLPEGLVVEDMALDSNNHIYFVGCKYVGNKQGVIAKFNEYGDTLYQKNVVSTNANSRILTTSTIYVKDNFVYYSSIENKNTLLNDTYGKVIVKSDSSGNTIWKKTLPEINPKNVSFLPIVVNSSNNVIVLEPFFNDTSNLYQTIIHVLNDQGNFSKAIKLYSANQNIQLINAQVDGNNNYYFSGLTTNNNSKSDIILMKMNSDFDIEWKKIFGKYTENDYQYYNFGHKALKYSNNTIFLTGYSFESNTQNANAAPMQTMFSTYLPTDGSLDGTYNGVVFAELGDVLQIEYAGHSTSNSNVSISDDLFFDTINLNIYMNVESEIMTSNNSNIAGANTIESNVFFDYIAIDVKPDRSYLLPNADGQPGQALVTDGAGNVYWKSVTISTEPFFPNVILDWTGKDIIRMALQDSITITNTGAFDGQKCILELRQPPTGNAIVTFTDETRFSLSIPYFDASNTGNLTDKIGFIFNAPDDKYDVVAISIGH